MIILNNDPGQWAIYFSRLPYFGDWIRIINYMRLVIGLGVEIGTIWFDMEACLCVESRGEVTLLNSRKPNITLSELNRDIGFEDFDPGPRT